MAQDSLDDNSICEPAPPTTINNARTALGRINTAVYTYNNLKHMYNGVRNWRNERKTRHAYSIAIDANDRFYFEVQRWLMTQVNPKDQRAIRLVSYDYDDTGDKLYKLFDTASDEQRIKVDGHEVRVCLEQPLSGKEFFKTELMGSNAVANAGTRAKIDSPRLVFWTYSETAHKAVEDFLDKLKEESTSRKRSARLHLLAGYWNSTSQELPERSIDSLVLHDGQMDRILADLEQFLRSEKDYAKKGIPWHRGYFFHGPPGTGKSSLAKVLASHFGLDLYYYPIGAANSDTEITNTIAKVSPKSILLLEDIDVFKGFKRREGGGEAEANNFSTSGLLNMLDGVMTPHGMIVILTANHPEVVDEAIFRPGRIDLNEEIGFLEKGQADKIFKAFYEIEPSESIEVFDIAPALIMEILKRNMHTPELAEMEISALRGRNVEYTKPKLILPTADDDEEEPECKLTNG